MRKVFSTVNVVIAIVAGALVLLGYFAPVIFGGVRDTVIQVAIILAGFALLVGIANLLSVHWKKLSTSLSKGVYSGVLLFGFVVTVVVVGFAGPTGYWSLWIFNSIQVPVEASLMAILAIVLVYAAARLLRHRADRFGIIFFITVLVVLLGAAPIYMLGELAPVKWLHTFITQWVAVGGARGLLLGVAIGTIATGLRILMGADRPYGG